VWQLPGRQRQHRGSGEEQALAEVELFEPELQWSEARHDATGQFEIGSAHIDEGTVTPMSLMVGRRR
jgi:hypothetical protein